MSTQGSSGGGFNFDTEAGIAQLLKSVRKANLSGEERNDIRDTIFLYINGGRDQTVRIALEQKLASHGIVPTGPVPGTQPAAGGNMGFTRSAPSDFSVSASAPQTPPQPASPPTPQPATPTPPPVQQPAPATTPVTPSPAPQTPPQPASPPTPQPATPTPPPVQQPAPATTPVAPSPAPQTPPQPASPPTPQPAAQPTTIPASATPPPSPQPAPAVTVPGQNPEVYLERIREIKSMVNQKVGNPVNLVDINNEVGREYMGALLDAMKKINSGASAVSAMQRLENAYKSVEQAIVDHKASSSPTPAVPTPPPTLTPPSVSQPAPIPAPQPAEPPPPPIPPPTPEPQPVPPPPKPEPKPEPKPVPPPPPPPPKPEPKPEPKPVPPPPPPPPKPEPKPEPKPVPPPPPPKPEPKPEPKPVPPPPKPEPSQESKPEEQKSSRVPLQDIPDKINTDTAKEEIRWSGSKNSEDKPISKIPSLADSLSEDKAKKDSEKKEIEVPKPEYDDPLYSKEVDEGLNQLLTEWSLFKKSGLFGTGPKGREHPLFKKIAGLQIPLLLAGRFEGATQEIKQSITDYMNGWRYEQGIMYMQGETFEKYLRRVIKHILDLQKKKTPA